MKNGNVKSFTISPNFDWYALIVIVSLSNSFHNLFLYGAWMQTLDRLGMDESSKDRKVAVPAMKDTEAWHRFCFATELGVAITEPSNNPADNPAVTETETPNPAESSSPLASNVSETTAGVGGFSKRKSAINSEAARAMVKRKRDLAHQLGISLVKRTDETDTVCVAEPTVTQGCEDSDSSGEGDDNSLAENEAVAEAWAAANKAMQWSGAVDVEPTTSILLQFDQVLTQRLLALQIEWLEER